MNPTDHQDRRDDRHHDEHRSRHRRRVSVQDHMRFRQAFVSAAESFDDIDELMADPLVERIGTRRREHETARVIKILDQLQH